MEGSPRSPDAPAPAGRPIGRRAFFGAVGVGASSILWGSSASRFLSQELHGVTSLLPAGVRAALVGESLMRSNDVAGTMRELFAPIEDPSPEDQ